VTAKGEDRNVPLIQWSLVNTFLVYLLMTVVGVFWAFVVEDPTKLSDSSALCLFWSWYNIVILAIACARMHRATKYRSARRLKSSERAELRIGNWYSIPPCLTFRSRACGSRALPPRLPVQA
jgi:cellulose synthase (UDP-forming)